MKIQNLKLKIYKDMLLDTAYYTEGPVIDREGKVYVTNLLGGAVLEIDDNGGISNWASCKSPNGQFIANDGDHWVCNTLKGTVEVFDRNGSYKSCAFDGNSSPTPVSSPNDLWVEPDGSFYFTDSIRYHGKVLYVDIAGKLTVLADDLDYPNGIVLDRKNNRLFIAESYQNRILTLDLSTSDATPTIWLGLPRNEELRESGNLPDGLALDANGGLWIAHYGMGSIYRVDMDSRELFALDVGFPLSSNICVQDGRLIITGGVSEPHGGKIRMIWYE